MTEQPDASDETSADRARPPTNNVLIAILALLILTTLGLLGLLGNILLAEQTGDPGHALHHLPNKDWGAEPSSRPPAALIEQTH